EFADHREHFSRHAAGRRDRLDMADQGHDFRTLRDTEGWFRRGHNSVSLHRVAGTPLAIQSRGKGSSGHTARYSASLMPRTASVCTVAYIATLWRVYVGTDSAGKLRCAGCR